MMHTMFDHAEVEGSTDVYDNAKDLWFGGSLDNCNGTMEWDWELS